MMQLMQVMSEIYCNHFVTITAQARFSAISWIMQP